MKFQPNNTGITLHNCRHRNKNVATAAMRLRIHPGKGCVTANNSMQKFSIYKMRNMQTVKTKLYSYVQTQPDVTYQPKWLTYFLIQYSLFMRHLFWAASGSFVNHIWARESSFTNAFVVTLACSELCVQCLTIFASDSPPFAVSLNFYPLTSNLTKLQKLKIVAKMCFLNAFLLTRTDLIWSFFFKHFGSTSST